MIKQGTVFELTFSVTDELTAQAVGSGTLPVLATPVLAARLEECAWRAVAPSLPAGSSTVGTHPAGGMRLAGRRPLPPRRKLDRRDPSGPQASQPHPCGDARDLPG